jgi:cell division septation protein DedD
VTEEKDGPVHYQVSVTGRQAAAFFLVLIASLGLSFFFGMKTGAAAKKGPDPISALTAQSDIAVPAAEAAGDAPRATPAPTEAPIGFGAPTRSEPPAAKAEPPAKAEAPADEPKPVVKEIRPEPTEATAPKAAPAKAEAPKPAASAPAEEGPFWVQVLVTKSAQKADTLSKKLKADGFKPDVALVPGKEGLFRVRVGPYPDRPKAEAGAKKVEKLEKLETTIVPSGK